MAVFEFKLPDIGEGVHEGEIVRWMVKEGDVIKEDEPLVEVMTDKVTAEIPSPVSGTIQKLHAKAGEQVHVGSVIVTLDRGGNSAETAQNTAVKQPEAIAVAAGGGNGNGVISPQKAMQASDHSVLAAPATRKLARSMGVPLEAVAGTGPKGRITPADVQAFSGKGNGVAHSAAPSKASIPVPKPVQSLLSDKRVPFTGVRKKIAENLVHSKQTIPHFAYVDEVDVTELVALRSQLKTRMQAEGYSLSYLPFVMKAVVAGLEQFPVLNAALDETTQEIVYRSAINLGIATDAPQGLIVPVIQNVASKSIKQLAIEIQTLAEKARNNQLPVEAFNGGTLTLTSIGSIGGLFGTPIIVPGQVAILGINKIRKAPVVITSQAGEDSIAIRQVMNLSISCDHRIVDGAEAARFINVIKAQLEAPAQLLWSDQQVAGPL